MPPSRFPSITGPIDVHQVTENIFGNLVCDCETFRTGSTPVRWCEHTHEYVMGDHDVFRKDPLERSRLYYPAHGRYLTTSIMVQQTRINERLMVLSVPLTIKNLVPMRVSTRTIELLMAPIGTTRRLLAELARTALIAMIDDIECVTCFYRPGGYFQHHVAGSRTNRNIAMLAAVCDLLDNQQKCVKCR